MSNIEQLIRRLEQGTITEAELSELNQLTHRSQVWQAASHKATVIRRRRHAGITAACVVLLVGGLAISRHTGIQDTVVEGPLVAQQVAEPSVATAATSTPAQSELTTPQEAIEDSHFEAVEHIALQDTAPVERQVKREPVESVAVVTEELMPTIHAEGDAVVACNTQCSADSVISDIWKFLRA